MNVNLIHQLNRDEAFAKQFIATEYQTFVAMPFGNQGGYPVQRIRSLLRVVHESANQLLPSSRKRRFAELRRVDETTSGTMVITDEIIRQILDSHFFWADLTGCNFGVVLETGLALALKPNERVLVFTQDGMHSLHFDLKVTRIAEYNEETLVSKLAGELVKAAQFFEAEADRYIRFVSIQLTSDAIMLLNLYGRRWKNWPSDASQPSLFQSAAAEQNPIFAGEVGRVLFQQAARELSSRGLFWTDYRPNAAPGADAYGIHATKLGWLVISHLWNHDPQMREPSNAPTAPNRDDGRP
jgi:hypothetical protein